MAEAALELRAILDAAEQAAAAEDFVSAERHLRQAAKLQEAHLGPMHHDLANTLNNLGIVYEHVGKAADAEACYRRAYRIARTSLPPDHPLVKTSGQNLRDFCAAVGKPFELPEPPLPELDTFASEAPTAKTKIEPPPALKPIPAAAPAPASAPKPKPQPVPIAAPLPPKPAEVAVPQPPPRQPTTATRIALPVSPPPSRPTASIVVGAALVVALAVWWFGLRESATPTSPAELRVETAAPREEPVAPRQQPVAPREEPAPPAASVIPERAPEPAAPEKPEASKSRASVSGGSKDAPVQPANEPSRSARAAASGDVSVADAKLCRSLSTSNWVCTPAKSPAAPGVFFFYTRVRSSRDVTVQHRWLMNGRLVRSVSLRIGANPGAGYRTYSRNTVNAERRGDWTIELRDGGGALLREERFTVQ
jgi:hypothetical protein